MSIFSAPALSFLIIMINAAIALVLLAVMDRRWPHLALPIPRRTLAWNTGIAVGVTVAWVALSLYIYAQVSAQMGPQVRVASVQTGRENAPPSFIGGTNNRGLTPEQNEARRARQQEQLVSMTRDATYLPTGEVAGQPYYKVHPVFAHGEAFQAPDQYPQYQTPYPTCLTPIGQLGVIICWDHDFPNSAARLEAVTGADIIAVPAWDPRRSCRCAGSRWSSARSRTGCRW